MPAWKRSAFPKGEAVVDGVLAGADRRHAVRTHGPLAPLYVVLHFTQMGSVRSSVDVLNARGFGYHVLVDRDGTVHQTAPFDRMVHHAGASNWRGRKALNAFSVGVSLANHGPLRRAGGRWRTLEGQPIADADVVEGSHANGDPLWAGIGWERFPAPQVEAALDVCASVASAYPIRDVIRHDDVAVGRKLDTGPALDMTPFHALIADRSGERLFRHRVVAPDGAELRSTHAAGGRGLGRLARGEEVYVLSRAYAVNGTASRLGPWCLVSRDGLERSGFMRARDLEALDPGLGGAGEVEEAVV